MKSSSAAQKGFTAAEIVVVVAIIVILVGIGTLWFSSARKSKTVETTRDNIVAALEKAKMNAVSGLGGSSYGVKFNANSYVTFAGSSYSAGNTTNISFPIDPAVTITNNIPGSDDAIIFARMSGIANATGTIIVSQISDSTVHKDASIGSQGEITVIQ